MIGLQIVVWDENGETKYELKENYAYTKENKSTLLQASMLLAAMHVAENRLIRFIEDCEPDLKYELDE